MDPPLILRSSCAYISLLRVALTTVWERNLPWTAEQLLLGGSAFSGCETTIFPRPDSMPLLYQKSFSPCPSNTFCAPYYSLHHLAPSRLLAAAMLIRFTCSITAGIDILLSLTSAHQSALFKIDALDFKCRVETSKYQIRQSQDM